MIDLTPRELEVIRLLAGGMTRAEIAFALDTPTTAVDQVLAEVTSKLGAADVADAVARAIASGFIPIKL